MAQGLEIVVDLALGHLKTIEKVVPFTGVEAITLVQVRRKIPYTFVERRPGDVAVCYADPYKAMRGLGWMAERGIEEMCADACRWQLNNPPDTKIMKKQLVIQTK